MSPARVDFADPAGGEHRSPRGARRRRSALQVFDSGGAQRQRQPHQPRPAGQRQARAGRRSRSPRATWPTTSSSTRRAGSRPCSTAAPSTRSRASRSRTSAATCPPDTLARINADVAARTLHRRRRLRRLPRRARRTASPASTTRTRPRPTAGPYAAFPRYPGLLEAAQRPFQAAGLDVPVVHLARQPRRPRPGQRARQRGPLPRDRDGLPEGVPERRVRPQALRGRLRRRAVRLLRRPGVHPAAARRRQDRRAGPRPPRSSPSASTARCRIGHGFAYTPRSRAAHARAAPRATTRSRRKKGFRFISLDTVAEGGGQSGNIDDPQYRWLRGELRTAKRKRPARGRLRPPHAARR